MTCFVGQEREVRAREREREKNEREREREREERERGKKAFAYLKTVVMLKQPWHLTSMKNEFGDWTKRLSLCCFFSKDAGGFKRSMSLCKTMMFL